MRDERRVVVLGHLNESGHLTFVATQLKKELRTVKIEIRVFVLCVHNHEGHFRSLGIVARRTRSVKRFVTSEIRANAMRIRVAGKNVNLKTRTQKHRTRHLPGAALFHQRVEQQRGDVCSPRRVADQKDPTYVAAVAADVDLNPLNGQCDILSAARVGRFVREPVWAQAFFFEAYS